MAIPHTIEHASDHATAEEVKAVWDGLMGYNRAQVGPDNHQRLVLLVRDEAGTVVGGLLGDTFWGGLAINILWLAESLRGQGVGSALLAQAEQIARERGCHTAHLDTMSFQAPDFYLKHGYTLFGTLPGIPRGQQRFFFYKRLVSLDE